MTSKDIMDVKVDTPSLTSVHAPKQQRGPQLSFNEVEAVNVSVRNLSVRISPQSVFVQQLGLGGLAKRFGKKAPDGTKRILDDVSVDVPSGSVMAIIGGSGSGKVDGLVTFNGHTNIHKVRHAYVLQQDVLLPKLTARETLLYSADLRLPSDTTAEERQQLVEEVILELGLKECADTMVGDNDHKGLSGGEKRRLSIGIQLLSNPSVLFLDEPTTGLDAFSAQLLVQTLRKLASKGRTLITSIHQPRSDIFFLFDNITLLSKGQPVYIGPVKESLAYFGKLGHLFPTDMNPADCMIDLAAYDSRSLDQQAQSTRRIAELVREWRRAEQFGPVALEPEPPALVDAHAPLLREIAVLTKRSTLITVRDEMGLLAMFLEAILNGIINGWIFYGLDGSLTGIKSQLGAVYASNGGQGYLILMYEAYRLSSVDIKVFDREHNEGMVSVTGFLVSRRLARLVTEDIAVPLLYSVIFYFMVGFEPSARTFFLFFLNVLLQHYANVTLATAAVAISREYSVAVLVGNLVSTVQTMSCGFYLQTSSMPVYVRWLKWVAFQFYGYSATCSALFSDYFGDCPYGDRESPNCEQYTGAFQLKALAIRRNWIGVPLVVVLCFCIGMYSFAGALFYIKPFDISVASSKPASEVSARVQAEVEKDQHTSTARPISVSVDNVTLGLEKRNLRFRKHRIDILRGITASFEPGQINAILGPSGSGKSSLLNLISMRLHSTLFSHYFTTGSILFGGQHASIGVLKSICSYVTQEDDGLLPTLTVRETLQFAADLRLPKFLTSEQKRARVEDVIAKMGLRDCADTLIGSEFLKGVSGGEKRRVSISVQLLNDPKVLLLDEPTSGLDSFTAASILTVLKALAEEGRTVVCTIHQPRSDLFSYFGNILLLAKGGRVAYSGPGRDTVKSYFAECGYPCPPLTNPADHIVDLVSINLQDPESEAETRARVNAILDMFANHKSEKVQELSGRLESPAELGSLQRESASFGRALPVLVRRQYVDMRRNPVALASRFGQIVGFGVLMALFFSPVKHDYVSIQNRIGIIQQFSAMYFVGMLCNIALYPIQRDVFYREQDDGVYGTLPFLTTYSIFEVPLEIINSLIFAVFMVMVTGIHRTVGMFFASAFMCFAIVNCGESIGIAFNTVFKHAGFAANMISIALSIGTLMSGIMSYSMMGFLRGFSYINPLMYGSKALFNYGFEGVVFVCKPEQLVDGRCPLATGDEVIDTYHMRVNKGKYLGILLVTVVYYRLLASILLKVMRLHLQIGKDD